MISKLKGSVKIYGFALGTEDEKEVLKLDAEGFNMSNLQLKNGVNNLSWMNEDNGSDANMELIVAAVSGDKKKVYETVNMCVFPIKMVHKMTGILHNEKVDDFGEIKYFIKSDYNPKYRYEEEYSKAEKDKKVMEGLQKAYQDLDVLEENGEKVKKP